MHVRRLSLCGGSSVCSDSQGNDARQSGNPNVRFAQVGKLCQAGTWVNEQPAGYFSWPYEKDTFVSINPRAMRAGSGSGQTNTHTRTRTHTHACTQAHAHAGTRTRTQTCTKYKHAQPHTNTHTIMRLDATNARCSSRQWLDEDMKECSFVEESTCSLLIWCCSYAFRAMPSL